MIRKNNLKNISTIKLDYFYSRGYFKDYSALKKKIVRELDSGLFKLFWILKLFSLGTMKILIKINLLIANKFWKYENFVISLGNTELCSLCTILPELLT